MRILRLGTEVEHWPAFVAHLRRVGMAQWVLDAAGHPTEPLLFLGALVDGDVVGDLALREQPVTAPATAWTGGQDREVHAVDGPALRETFVMTFAVDEAHRRRGIGRALQAEALRWTQERGCWQMRSWSSLDKPENYALKLSLGFAMHPAVHDAAGGYPVSGVYFVKSVQEPA